MDDLPAPVRSSLLKGYVERSSRMPWLADDYAPLATAPAEDDRAYSDGKSLRSALDTIFSADTISQLRQDEASYDALANELNERYGGGLVVLTSEGGTPGLRGFRVGPFTTMTETTRDEDSREVVTVHDLQAEDEAANEQDLAESRGTGPVGAPDDSHGADPPH